MGSTEYKRGSRAIARGQWQGHCKFKENRRERFLTGEELERLGSAIREGETTGIPWAVDESKVNAKHVPKAKRSPKAAHSLFSVERLYAETNLSFCTRCLL